MAEASQLAIWSSMQSWFSPMSLFVLINIVICTIVLVSSLGKSTQKEELNDGNNTPSSLVRTGSLLHRVKSFNLYRQKTEDLPAITTLIQPELHAISNHHAHENIQPLEESVESQPMVEQIENLEIHEMREDSVKPDDPRSEDADDPESAVRIESESKEKPPEREKIACGLRSTDAEKPSRHLEKMKKSASLKCGYAHDTGVDAMEMSRPATAKVKKTAFEDDEEVDAKAGDFINKFKQQLKLQRLESIMRYKEMIERSK